LRSLFHALKEPSNNFKGILKAFYRHLKVCGRHLKELQKAFESLFTALNWPANNLKGILKAFTGS
jgi:hypothetical protein